jgi:hypothetical protein
MLADGFASVNAVPLCAQYPAPSLRSEYPKSAMTITLPLDSIASFATEHPLAGGQPVPIVDAAPIGEAGTPLRGSHLGSQSPGIVDVHGRPHQVGDLLKQPRAIGAELSVADLESA